MYQTMIRYNGDNKKYAILSPLLVIIEVIVDVAMPYVMSLIIDQGIIKENIDAIFKYGLMLIAMVIISFLTGVGSGYYATKASAGFAGNLRQALFENIQSFSFKNIDEFKVGSLVTRLTSDVQYVQQAFQMSIRIAIRAPLMFLFAFIMAFRQSTELAKYFMLVIPFLLIAIVYITRRAYKIFDKAFAKIDDLNLFVSENLNCIRVVKSFVKEDSQIDEFTKVSNGLRDDFVAATKLVSLTNPAMMLTTYVIVIILAWVGARMIIDGLLTTGVLMSLITYAIQIQISLMMLSMIMVMLTIAGNSHRRIKEVLDVQTDIKSKDNALATIKDGSIRFEDVDFSYLGDKNKPVLRDINLDIKSGDYVGIIGPTGSSKSTLVNMIARLYDVTSGAVKVGGVDVRDYDLYSLREDVAVVLQKNVLFSGTVRSNMKWANKDLDDETINRALEIAQAKDFVDAAGGLDAKVERGGLNFSGGQKQRLCIARAILKKPKILILDDSTSALDNNTEKNIINALNKIMPDMTKIIISQRITSIKACDYIAVMNLGKIEALGTHDELLVTSKIYKDIAELSGKGGDFDERK